jgi:glycosyltransferase involved in cell wall biosynthesis
MRPFLSTIVPTIGRPSLTRTIQSLLDEGKSREEHEIIVVNDSGEPLGVELDRERVHELPTVRRHQSVARNAGAAVARGRYLHFLDDDDWMEPGWFDEFVWLAEKYPQAAVLYGGCRIVNQRSECLGEVNLGHSGNCASHYLGGSWTQVGTAVIRADRFFEVGGFSPAILPSEETDLYRRIALTYDFASTPRILMNLLRQEGWQTTTPYETAVKNLRVSREGMLDAPAAWSRLRISATTPYWRGRNLKAYMASTLWNLRSRRWSTTFSRALYTGHTLLAAVPSMLNRDFWHALKDTQVPATVDRAMEYHQAHAVSAPVKRGDDSDI